MTSALLIPPVTQGDKSQMNLYSCISIFKKLIYKHRPAKKMLATANQYFIY